MLKTIPLGPQWQTLDPFLFCAHHDDAYPAGSPELGPAPELLAGRSIGQDFAGIDGWNMYHGQVVPGFPQHPHRGFETISFVRKGLIDHSDSLGATARFGRGDVQWMTAGGGIVHAEMFPLLDSERANPVQLFQIWLNLPAEDKLVEPHFSMLWDEDIPRHRSTDAAGATTEVTVIAGTLHGLTPPSPPPHSWAARPDAGVAIWHVEMAPGATWTLPPADQFEAIRTIYLFEGGPITVEERAEDGVEDRAEDRVKGGVVDEVGGSQVEPSTGAVLQPTEDELLVTAGDGGASWMLLQGRPIAEPVAQYGPFVMNSRAEIEQAFDDYQRTRFGGWPWPSDDPNHGSAEGRFARHADGRVEHAG